MNLFDNDVDMAEIVKHLQDDPKTILDEALRKDVVRKGKKINELEWEMEALERNFDALEEKVSQDNYIHDLGMDHYQHEVMTTFPHASSHPSIVPLLTCFAKIGEVAERAKKAFRDNKGIYSEESKQRVWDAFEAFRAEVPKVILSLGKGFENPYVPDAPHRPCFPDIESTVYPILGLVGETGEFVAKILPFLEDPGKEVTEEDIEGILNEQADIFYYFAQLTHELCYRGLSSIAKKNLEKNRDRMERGVIHGDGDRR